MSVVERMSHALERLALAPASTAMLREVVHAAAAALGLKRVAIAWLGADGLLSTQAAPGPMPEALSDGVQDSWEASLVHAVRGARGSCLGMLLGCAEAPRDFSGEERRRFALFAQLAGLALERVRQGAAPVAAEGPSGCLDEAGFAARALAEAADARLRLLADVGTMLSGPVEWETAVSSVAQLAVGAFSDWCAVDFLDAHGALRRLTVRHAWPERMPRTAALEACTPERARPSAITEVVRSGRAQLLTGLGVSDPAAADGGPESEGGSLLVVPLVARHRTLGVMSFVRGPSSTPFTAADRSLAGDVAVRVGLTIDNARLLREAREAEAEARRHASRLRVLVDVDRMLAEAGLDLPAVLDVIAHKVSEVMGDGCVLQLSCEEGAFLEPVAIHHPDPEARWLLSGTVHARRQRLGDGLHGGVVLRGQAVLLPDVDAETARASGGLPEYLPFLERYGAQSLLVVPLVAKQRVFGTLGVVRDVAGGNWPYGEEDGLLLRGLAERAALAIADARAFVAVTEAVRLRDDFLSVAGHELKTPLSALRLQIQMLGRMTRDVAASQDLAQRVARAERTSERLGALVDELLDAGRITSGRLKLEREEMDLAQLTRDAVGRMTDALGRGGSEVRLIADEEVVGRWDRVRLEQVLGNLLSNAAKYGRGRPVEVRVERGGRGAVRLVVKDQGIGIAPVDQPRIFERFERAVTDRQFTGLGLGLWISREIIDAHGGSIQVHSAPGEGATFTVELPRE
ncbi:ATP-binding protein [Melittangium boletus]|uniref:histidine kinase n=1 Tax=Melittangium boletus DSM 14713 TaxID=1294270 RepID=A0A250IER6_9BACT|nr:ATP-binding protein [Melittangium boletus]ATB29637.1 hypothetical protein MEBOL_003092 [Melittangium boletus DSM 14713]